MMTKMFQIGSLRKDSTTESFQKNSTINKHYSYTLGAVRALQKSHYFLTLCGSVPLMIMKKIPLRIASDVDFVLNEKDFEKLELDRRLRIMSEDKYTEEINKKDKYKSYHGYFDAGNGPTITVNFLVFDDEIHLPWCMITDGEFQYRSQPLDTILTWKQKYNRKKDIKDLNDIANSELEDILAS